MNKITNIETQKRNEERVNIYIDNEFAFACYKEIVYKECLKKDMEVELERLRKIIEEEEFLKCKNSALRIVEKTYKTEKEMIDKLLQKGYEGIIIEKTIAFLKEYNFLNDEKYSLMYARDKSKIQGKNKIKYSLMKKGIDKDTIENTLESMDNSVEEETAYNLAIKKYRILSKKENDKYKLNQKLIRFLLGKGYDYGLIKSVIKKVTNEEVEANYE
ncbi:recombination regulator RecX [Clostridium massiliamazoniense]|uniref:recombination regulator RecX n=1 Tax=Clostridium massiliamazoniense TaxID=1347366 RepID=UPI0006D80A67|nr:recombination regulator RecX [Clostridium massiliamazoniense]